MKFEIIYKRIAQSLLIVGPLATLAVSPSTSFDPINLIKLVFITSIAFLVFGLLVSSFKYSVNRISNVFWISAGFFVIAMVSTFLFSGAPWNQQLWGSFGRNTGLLTYFSLLIILVGSALIQKVDFYHRIVNSLVLTAVPMTLYCLIQVVKLDPIGWSEHYPFGTLGNINFSSGFYGLTSIAGTVLIFEKKLSKSLRFAIGAMVVIDILIVYSTGSIQGLMSFIASIGVVGYLYLRSILKLRILKIPYLIAAIFGIVITSFGLVNKGPLASFIYAPSVVFRGDYMHAGWAMTWSHPFVGIGLDSYGDWYRSARGLLSTTRNNPERIANTAHNIFLDISSNGGIPMIFGYILLLFFALRAVVRVLKRDKIFRPYFVALFATWFGYQVQSSISINQVGVGIWGWLFTGSLIGYEICTRNQSSGLIENTNSTSARKNKRKNSNLPASSGLVAFFSMTIGFILAFVPFNADMAYRSSIQTGELLKIMSSTEILGSSAFHLEMALDTAIKGNFTDQATQLTNQLLKKYPKDFMGWKAKYFLTTSTSSERSEALRKMHELDPFNPEIPKS